MIWRIVPDRAEVLRKLSVRKRELIWDLTLDSYQEIAEAANEADRLQRTWGVHWHVILDGWGNDELWAKAVGSYKKNGCICG
jgi:hypothetical protein